MQTQENVLRQYLPGLCSVTFRQHKAEDVIDLAALSKVRAIEWGSDIHVPVGDVSTAAKVRTMCQQAHISPASYGTYLRSGTGNSIEYLASIVDTAAALGAQNIRVWGGPRGMASADADENVWRQAADELRNVAELAAASDLTLSLEFHADTLVDTGQSAIKLLQSVDHPALFTKWQPTPGITKQEALEQLAMIAPWLSYIDVFARDNERKRYLLSEFSDLWLAVFQKARPAPSWRTTPFAMIEFVKDDAVSSLQDDVRSLKDFLTATQSRPAQR